MMRPEVHIDGRWSTGHGEVFAACDPATGDEVWRGHAASPADIRAACQAARAAFPGWSRCPYSERVAVLQRFAKALEARGDAFVETICRETGKPRWEARTELRSMVGKIPITIEAHARRCGEFQGGAAVTRFRPHGVVGVFGPFNFPGHLPNGHIAPALLAGNTVVFKPSERTPGVAALMVEAWCDAGLPAGVLNLVHGGREAGQTLASQRELDGVYFTGSAHAGRWLHTHFAGRPEVILALEMGGNNPLIAWSVRDIAGAVLAIVQSAYITAGQRCTCARRLIVSAGAEGDAVIDTLTAAVRGIRVGVCTDDPEPFMGPVIGSDIAIALLKAQQDLIAHGARPLALLRHLVSGTGRVAPGLLDVTNVKDRPDEELFGPLLQVIRVNTFDAALAEASATRFGLAAGLLSDDAQLWERFQTEVRAGIVNWNQPLTGASSAAPFGGVGASGNHRPGALFAADYCSFPVASIETPSLTIPTTLPPGLGAPDHE